MESGSWTTRYSTSSKRHQSTLQSRSDLYLGFEEIEVDDDLRAEFACPFCSDDFDIVGLCCHIDEEHPIEAKNGVCPICANRVGTDLVGHITMQHGSFFKGMMCIRIGLDLVGRITMIYKMQRRRRFRKGSSGSHSTLSLLRKELRDGHLQSLLKGSCVVSNTAAPDPLLSSFIYNMPTVEDSKNVEPRVLDEGSMLKKNHIEKAVESVVPPLSDKDQKERAQRSMFVQGLLMSTIFDDYGW